MRATVQRIASVTQGVVSLPPSHFKEVVMDTFDRVCVVFLIVAAFTINFVFTLYVNKELDNFVSPQGVTSESQVDIERLKAYEEIFNDHDLTLTYNGCEDMRERLGL